MRNGIRVQNSMPRNLCDVFRALQVVKLQHYRRITSHATENLEKTILELQEIIQIPLPSVFRVEKLWTCRVNYGGLHTKYTEKVDDQRVLEHPERPYCALSIKK